MKANDMPIAFAGKSPGSSEGMPHRLRPNIVHLHNKRSDTLPVLARWHSGGKMYS